MDRVLITNANIIDVLKGQSYTGDILITDGKIEQIGSSIKSQDSYEVIDLKGKSVVPGLFNCHVHVTTWDPWSTPR